MDRFFTELGKTIAHKWKAQNFSPTAFPETAQTSLEEAVMGKKPNLSALMEGFLLRDEQPFQTHSDFGQPELIVYNHPRFYIQVLLWLEGTTEVHQHQFSGAFHVMEGSSLHSRYSFEASEPVSAHLKVGRLRWQQSHLLETGATAQINSGAGYIHSLFHLETPSATIVVRTHSDPGMGPQFTYLPPHVAIDPFLDDPLTTRRKQLLEVLEKTNSPRYQPVLLQMVQTLDFERGFFILQHSMEYLKHSGGWEEIWTAFETRHGILAPLAKATLDEIVWRDALIGLRSSVEDVEHRFFLALLLNVPHCVELLRLVGSRFAADSVATVFRWLEELAEGSPSSPWMLDAEFPLEVKVPPARRWEVFSAALRRLMKAAPDEAVAHGLRPISAGDLEHFHAAFMRSSLRPLIC